MRIMSALAKAPEEPAPLTAETWLNDLDNRETIFVLAYLRDLDVVAACREAGYAESMAQTRAYTWLRNNQTCEKPHVARAIQFGMDARAEALLVDAYMVVEELKAIAFADPRKAMDWSAYINETEDELGAEGGEPIMVIKTVSNRVTLRNAEDLDKATAHAIKAVKQDKDGNVSITFHDKAPALQLLARHLGMAAGAVQVRAQVDHRHLHIHAGMPPKEAAQAWMDTIKDD